MQDNNDTPNSNNTPPKVVVLTPDEIVDFGLRVGRLVMNFVAQPENILPYMLHLQRGAVDAEICTAFLAAFYHELTHPAQFVDSSPSLDGDNQVSY